MINICFCSLISKYKRQPSYVFKFLLQISGSIGFGTLWDFNKLKRIFLRSFPCNLLIGGVVAMRAGPTKALLNEI